MAINTMDLQETIELLTPIFEPVVEDIQTIKDNTSQANQELEAVKEAVENPASAEPVSEENIEQAATSTETISEKEKEAQASPSPESVEVAPEEELPDYQKLTYEAIQEQNTLLQTVTEQQVTQQEIMQDGFMMVILTIVVAIGIKTFVEQVTKW